MLDDEEQTLDAANARECILWLEEGAVSHAVTLPALIVPSLRRFTQPPVKGQIAVSIQSFTLRSAPAESSAESPSSSAYAALMWITSPAIHLNSATPSDFTEVRAVVAVCVNVSECE